MENKEFKDKHIEDIIFRCPIKCSEESLKARPNEEFFELTDGLLEEIKTQMKVIRYSSAPKDGQGVETHPLMVEYDNDCGDGGFFVFRGKFIQEFLNAIDNNGEIMKCIGELEKFKPELGREYCVYYLVRIDYHCNTITYQSLVQPGLKK